MLVLLLSTAWIFGPLASGEAELRAGAAYQQSNATNAEGRAVQTRRMQALIGADVAVLKDVTIGLQIPFEWAQTTDRGQLFYRRSEIADLSFEVRYAFAQGWHSGVRLVAPGHDSDQALGQRYPDNAHRFPEVGGDQIFAGAFVSALSTRNDWIHAARLTLMTGVENQAVATLFKGYSGLRFFQGWLTIGPVFELDIRTGDSGSERYRLGLLERIGPDNGWAFELMVHTDPITDQIEVSTGATASLVWRK